MRKPFYDTNKLKIISDLAADRIEELLTTLEVEFTAVPNGFRGRCPVHDGDNPTGWMLFTNGDQVRLRWACFTGGCHSREKFGANIFGFVRGVLTQKEGKNVSFKAALDFLCKFVECDYDKMAVDVVRINKVLFTANVTQLSKQRSSQPNRIKKHSIRNSLVIPSPYFIRRGFSPSILKKYLVGDCLATAKPMSGRAVVPVFDDSGEFMVGCTGRSITPQCQNCRFFHVSSVPCPVGFAEETQYCKWRNAGVGQEEFEASRYLYNYWSAQEHIRREGVAILVEGAADVWKLEESNIHCGLAMFGTSLKDDQQLILEQSGAMTIIVLTDNDEAGRKAAERIKTQLGKLYRLYFPTFAGHDVGDLNTSEITQDIAPLLRELSEFDTISLSSDSW